MAMDSTPFGRGTKTIWPWPLLDTAQSTVLQGFRGACPHPILKSIPSWPWRGIGYERVVTSGLT